jgi:hypothetical protein
VVAVIRISEEEDAAGAVAHVIGFGAGATVSTARVLADAVADALVELVFADRSRAMTV